VSRSLVAYEDLVGLLQAIVDSVAEALPADRVSLIIVDPDARLVTRLVKGGPGADLIVDVPYKELMAGLAGWVFRERRPTLSPGSEPDPRESAAVQLRRHETLCGSLIVVPLVHRETILGVMVAINRPEQREFDQRDLDLIMSMAGQAAAALESASVEWERTQSALRASEERCRRITETITDYMFTVSVADGVAAATIHGPGCVAVTGYTPDEFARDPDLWLSMVVPEAGTSTATSCRSSVGAC
jgi:GAF domain-containing protein